MFRRKTRVILDTNVFMLPNRGIDIFSLIDKVINGPYELCTLSSVFSELEKLSKGTSKDAFAAKLGYVMAKQKALKSINCSSRVHVDDVLVEKTTSRDIVVTQDRELIQRLRDKGVRVLRYQQKKFVFQ